MNRVYLLTGGNLGDRGLALEMAREKSRELGNIRSVSPVFETEAWGLHHQAPFYNQALELETLLKPQDVLERILAIERSMGRSRQTRYGPRYIDIDILFYNDLVLSLPGLQIPHPQLHNRRFALVCMNEIAPALVHPVLGKNIAALLEICSDSLKVKKIMADIS